MKELNEMTIGRTDDPENPFVASAREVASVFGAGSRTPSGPAVMAPRRQGRTHDRNRPTPSDFSRSVWDDWDARTPEDQAAGVLTADDALVARVDELTPGDAAKISIPLGPFTLTFDQYLGLRLNEHVLHTWDVEVMFNADAVIPSEAVGPELDNLGFVARFAAKPSGAEGTYVVRTKDPVKSYVITLATDAVTTVESDDDAPADVELPAEAFIRLLCGRLDADHTPSDVTGVEHLDALRAVFPGF